MTETDSRSAIVARIEAERDHWRDLLAQVGEDRMTEPGPMGEWSFKDLAAHLLGWRNRTIGRLEAAATGAPEPPAPWPPELDEVDDDDDAINAWIQEQSRDRSVRDVLDAVEKSYARMGAAVAVLPEEMVTLPDAFPWLEGTSLRDTDLFGHLHEEHEPAIRAWLARRA